MERDLYVVEQIRTVLVKANSAGDARKLGTAALDNVALLVSGASVVRKSPPTTKVEKVR